jgi:hypothetical protein
MEFNVEIKFQTQNEGETTVNTLIKGLRIFHYIVVQKILGPTAVILRIESWDVTLCHWVSGEWCPTSSLSKVKESKKNS